MLYIVQFSKVTRPHVFPFLPIQNHNGRKSIAPGLRQATLQWRRRGGLSKRVPQGSWISASDVELHAYIRDPGGKQAIEHHL